MGPADPGTDAGGAFGDASGRDDGTTSALAGRALRGAGSSRITGSWGVNASGLVAGAKLAAGAATASRASAYPHETHVAVPITA